MAVTIFSPAKLNLSLAVTGRRADGFHDLVSVVAPVAFGDELTAEMAERFSLTCDVAELAVDGTNLILRAAAAFVRATGWSGAAKFHLTKRIPVGAGLGGGSSNAVAALRALNKLSGERASAPELTAIATALGSDCALFLHEAPVVMGGRGELVERLPESAAARLRGRRVLIFKPTFGVSTPWAYGRMVARGGDYVATATAEAQLAAWFRSGAPAEELLGNNMEAAVFAKYVALPVLLEGLRRDFGVAARMSGSGSACFALLSDEQDAAALRTRIAESWGETAHIIETRLA